MRKLGPSFPLIVILLSILIFFSYYFPIQRCLAQRKFKQYITLQGTSLDNIASKKISKDYKTGGYYITVIYKDDPNFTYRYTYLPSRDMFCFILDEHNTSTDITNKKTKYKSLE